MVNASAIDWWTLVHVLTGLLFGYILVRFGFSMKQTVFTLIVVICLFELFEQSIFLDWSNASWAVGSIIDSNNFEGESLINSVTDVLITFLGGFSGYIYFSQREQ
jgi:hypothetical protein